MYNIIQINKIKNIKTSQDYFDKPQNSTQLAQ